MCMIFGGLGHLVLLDILYMIGIASPTWIIFTLDKESLRRETWIQVLHRTLLGKPLRAPEKTDETVNSGNYFRFSGGVHCARGNMEHAQRPQPQMHINNAFQQPSIHSPDKLPT